MCYFFNVPRTYRYINIITIRIKRKKKKSGTLVGIDLSVAVNVFPVKVTVGQIENSGFELARCSEIMCNCRFSMTFYISINGVYFFFSFLSRLIYTDFLPADNSERRRTHSST